VLYCQHISALSCSRSRGSKMKLRCLDRRRSSESLHGVGAEREKSSKRTQMNERTSHAMTGCTNPLSASASRYGRQLWMTRKGLAAWNLRFLKSIPDVYRQFPRWFIHKYTYIHIYIYIMHYLSVGCIYEIKEPWSKINLSVPRFNLQANISNEVVLMLHTTCKLNVVHFV
jgi:hypothetical protein